MKQVVVALKYLGQSELAGNTFTDDTPLGKLVLAAGQKKGEAWCAYFAEGVFCEAYPEKAAAYRKLFSSGAVKTLNNFKDAGYTVFQKPSEGALVIWQKFDNGKPGWEGHIGIVKEVLDDGVFVSIEGNTTKAGSREGTTVLLKTRSTKQVAKGLNVIGFVRP